MVGHSYEDKIALRHVNVHTKAPVRMDVMTFEDTVRVLAEGASV